MANTYIDYEATRANAASIVQSASSMENILNEFSTTVNRLVSTDFKGTASDNVATRFAALRSTFNDYVRDVNRFAQTINAAVDANEQTEKNIDAAGSHL